jgi:hypothetical protein
MGRAVGADEPCAVDREDHREMLQGDVVDDLVVRPLEERRVDRRDRPGSVAREPRREADPVRLRDPDVEEALRVLRLEPAQPGAARHPAVIATCAGTPRLHPPWPGRTPPCRTAAPRSSRAASCGHLVERAHAVKRLEVRLGRREACPAAQDEGGPALRAGARAGGRGEGRGRARPRAEVVEAERLEQASRTRTP